MNVREFKYKGKSYRSGSKENSLKKLALAIIRDYAHNRSVEDLLKELNGVCSTSKGKALLVKTDDVIKNEELKGWYFEDNKELVKVRNVNYSLYAWWNSSDIEKLIKTTKVKMQ